jgi:glycosyltransferase involved in cell wall biosynthesis
MKNKPTVTAVIPAYNYGCFLSEAIDSVLSQTYLVHEVIVVDDGSTDNTPEVAGRYGDRIHLIRTANQGVSAARNAAIAVSKGDLIALLDADDRWLPAKIERQVAAFDGDPTIGMVHSGARIFDSNTNATLCEILPETKIDFHDMLTWNGISLPSAVVPRKVFQEVGVFDVNHRGAADWEMWIRIAAKYRLVSCREVLVDYRIHGNNMSNRVLEHYQDCMAVLDKSCSIHSNCQLCRTAIRSARERVREVYYDKSSAIARDCLREGRYLKGFAWRVRSIVRYPRILLQAPRILQNRVFGSYAS